MATFGDAIEPPVVRAVLNKLYTTRPHGTECNGQTCAQPMVPRPVLVAHRAYRAHTHTQTHTHGGWGIMTLQVVNGKKCLDKCMVFVAMQPSMFGLLPGHDGVLCRPGSRVRPGITKLMQPGSCFPRAVRWLPNDFPRGPQELFSRGQPFCVGCVRSCSDGGGLSGGAGYRPSRPVDGTGSCVCVCKVSF